MNPWRRFGLTHAEHAAMEQVNGMLLEVDEHEQQAIFRCRQGTVRIRRFLKKNFLLQDVGAGLIKMSYLGKAGWRFNRFSTACIAAFPSEIPFW